LRIAIVTPWLNHLELADDYFEAVLPEMEDGDENIIVDNGSEPPLQFATLSPGANLGFCGGSNLGLHSATADAVLFLNNDIVLERRGWLNEIREALEPGVLVGPLRDGRHADVDGQAFPYLDGWCLAGMRQDLLSLGGFDESLSEPAYFSDNLLCLVARVAGMELRPLRPGLRHLENRTAGDQWNLIVRAASSDNHARYQARVREVLAAV
jgi:GT2 family glycosyltransferase